jgi:transposase
VIYDMRNKFGSGAYGGNMHERCRRKAKTRARMLVVERLWNEGVLCAAIAEKTGVSVEMIKNDLKALRAVGRIKPRHEPRAASRPKQKAMAERSTRADDERLLLMLAARDDGGTTRQIGDSLGLRHEYVRAATNRVHRAYKLSLTHWYNGREWVAA